MISMANEAVTLRRRSTRRSLRANFFSWWLSPPRPRRPALQSNNLKLGIANSTKELGRGFAVIIASKKVICSTLKPRRPRPSSFLTDSSLHLQKSAALSAKRNNCPVKCKCTINDRKTFGKGGEAGNRFCNAAG